MTPTCEKCNGPKELKSGIRKCSRCGQPKTLDAFYSDRDGRDGRQSTCIECRVASQKARYAAASSSVCAIHGCEKTIYKRAHVRRDGTETTCRMCPQCRQDRRPVVTHVEPPPEISPEEIALEAAAVRLDAMRAGGLRLTDPRAEKQRYWKQLADEARKGARA